MCAAQGGTHRPTQLFGDVVARDPAARSVSEDGGLVRLVGLRPNHDHARAREPAARGAPIRVEGRRVEYDKVRPFGLHCLAQVLVAQRDSGPTAVIAREQLEGEVAHRRVLEGDEHARCAAAHRTRFG